jgi:hypothetical protein
MLVGQHVTARQGVLHVHYFLLQSLPFSHKVGVRFGLPALGINQQETGSPTLARSAMRKFLVQTKLRGYQAVRGAAWLYLQFQTNLTGPQSYPATTRFSPWLTLREHCGIAAGERSISAGQSFRDAILSKNLIAAPPPEILSPVTSPQACSDDQATSAVRVLHHLLWVRIISAGGSQSLEQGVSITGIHRPAQEISP